jgi:hypothetical protein
LLRPRAKYESESLAVTIELMHKDLKGISMLPRSSRSGDLPVASQTDKACSGDALRCLGYICCRHNERCNL